MAVAFDAVGPSSAGAGNTSQQTLSWTHTAVASNVTILVGCALDKASDAGVTLTCQCDGVTMTALTGNVEADAATQGFIQAWSISGQSSGAHTILVTASSTGTQDLEGGSVSFTGASGLGTPVTNAGTGITSSAVITGTTSGNLIFGFTASGEAVLSTTSPATSRFVNNQMGGGGFALGNCAGSTSAGGGSVTMAWGLTSSADPWAVIAVEVQAPATGTPGPASFSAPWSRVAVQAGFAGRVGAGHSQ